METSFDVLEMITVAFATAEDIETLTGLYRSLEEEMTALHPMWPLADGLPEPVSESLLQAIEDPNSFVIIGKAWDYPFGFLLGRVEETLPQSGGEKLGSIRLVYVEQEARQVAIGEEMLGLAMTRFRQLGLTRFDAHVLPGHRLAKNFFESGGFSARSIVMHHDDNK